MPCLLPIEFKIDADLIKDAKREQLGPGDNGDILIDNYESDNSMDPLELNYEIRKKKEELRRRLNNLDFSSAESREEIIQNTQILTYRKILYDKPIAIIYNPNSGKKRNVRQIIAERLDLAGVPYEFLESKKAFDTWMIP